jgi:hypothetical protein
MEIDYSLKNLAYGQSPVKSFRCPHCLQIGVFTSLQQNDFGNANFYFGQRKCPNSECQGHVFTVFDNKAKAVIMTFPQMIIPFDKSRIPARINAAFSEVLVCHSNNCFVASAIMIRKTLEEIAEDKKVQGKTLFERLNKLGQTIVVPKELLEAMNELRLLGNDAAHIEAKTYEEIGKEEIEISIEFTKEILKATYQYEDLLVKLRSLKKPT